MEKHHKFSMWYVLLGVWVVLIIQNMLFSALSVKVIPYSEFLKAVAENRVAEVAITSNQIQGRLKPTADSKEQGQAFRTIRVDQDLSQLLAGHGVTFKGEVESTFLRDLLSWVIPVFLFVGIWYFLIKRMQGQQPGFMMLGKNKAKIYVQDEVGVRFDDVAGVDESKQELKEVIEFLKEPGRFSAIGGRMPRGVLLVGPPGTGKTLLRQGRGRGRRGALLQPERLGVRRDVRRPGGRPGAGPVPAGQGQGPVHHIHRRTRRPGQGPGHRCDGRPRRARTDSEPAARGDGRFRSPGRGHPDGGHQPAGDSGPGPAAAGPLRPPGAGGPARPERPRSHLRVHLKKIKYDASLDIERLANMTPGMVGADLANLVNEAALLAVRRGKQQASMPEFQEAVERVIAGLEKKNRVINPKEKKIVAYHELGHAIVAMSLPGTDPVQKITVIPRGIAALGYTMQVPTEDRFLMCKTELENKIASLLGGRAAEEIVSGDISTGAHNDLSRATDIARSMVKEYGMSKIGQVYHASNRRAQFLNLMPESAGEYSEATAERIDMEINEIISAQYARALGILKDKRGALEKSVTVLLEKETIEGAELQTLMSDVAREKSSPAETVNA